MTSELSVPSDLAAEPPAFLAWARSLAIATPEAFTDAGDRLKQIKAFGIRVSDFFKPMKQSADEAKKRILDAERSLLNPCAEAERLTKNALLTYQSREREKAEAERRRLQQLADEQARKERERLEKRAAVAKKPETVERLQEEAASIVAPVVQVASAAPKANGISTRRWWKAEVIDLQAFLLYCCENKRTDLLLPNLKVLEALAKGLKEHANLPGVRFTEQESLAASGR